ncbi:hypothetical protein [Rheinheimera sp. UJ63]|uniref:hypothetical protein n=1 Tax=Rheinheimera sp. UJ63 TaxID=2910157 RepID=UPI001F26EF26|nr:hypothetical protein [Rheinheimera sp. UJ63]MCF4010659.1 hypothetical protein [Rheinheimera sp. UJ63]
MSFKKTGTARRFYMLNNSIIRVSLWVFSFAVFSLTLPACAQQPITDAPGKTTSIKNSTAYGDCALIDFKDIDSSALTKAELVQKMDLDFADNLNKSEKCMAEAINSGAGRISEVGTGGGNTGAAASTSNQAAGETQSESTANQQAKGEQESASSPSAVTKKDQGQSGSSAVCETVKQGVASATTDNEKKHFQALMTQYGCQG